MQDIVKKISKYGDIALAASVIAILMVLLFPIHMALLDILLAFSIGSSLVILMTTFFITKPLELSIFPTILLVTTMLRLSLNIASTRLILSAGHEGPSAAGRVIEAFGGFVMQGNVVIGLIVFLILTLINFIVITKGSGRIAEVAARFSLDSMPGKQMAIDADLAAGLIDEKSAKERRKNLEDESSFFGAMDGANKFVRGDAIAGLIITFINLVGGMIVGMLQKNLSFDSAVSTYTILTIGDGLVSQIPSLIISLAAGLLVTKGGQTSTTDKMLFGQLSKYPKALMMTGVVTFMVSLLPGLPFFSFLSIAVIIGGAGYLIQNIADSQKEADQNRSRQGTLQNNVMDSQAAGGVESDEISNNLQIDSVRLEIGYGLLGLLKGNRGENLTDRIQSLRKQVIKEYGFVIPAVRIRDNIQLPTNSYVIKIKELEAGRGVVKPDKLMLMDPHNSVTEIKGEEVREPVFGLLAKWINIEDKEEAIFNNCTVVDPATVITTHLTELIKENITELLSYSETQNLLHEIGEEHKQLVKDLVPETVSIATLQKVLQNLLSEMVSIRDLPGILEEIAESVKANKTIGGITEAVRVKIARQISHHNTNKDGFIPVITLTQTWEDYFINSLVDTTSGEKQLAMSPAVLQEFVRLVKKIFDEQALKGQVPVLLTSGYIRPYVRMVIARFRPSIVVMSQNEVHYKSKVRTLGECLELSFL